MHITKLAVTCHALGTSSSIKFLQQNIIQQAIMLQGKKRSNTVSARDNSPTTKWTRRSTAITMWTNQDATFATQENEPMQKMPERIPEHHTSHTHTHTHTHTETRMQPTRKHNVKLMRGSIPAEMPTSLHSLGKTFRSSYNR